jgi:hypothetical protein
MIYLKWLLLLPVMIAVTILTFPLAFILPLFAQYQEGRLDNNTQYGWGWYLPSWLNWFQTPDNSLDGDEGWRVNHWQWRFKLPTKLATYVGRIGWLWRNPGYGVGVEFIDSPVPVTATYTGNKNVNDSPGVEGYCFVKGAGLFQLVWVKKISDTKCIYCNFGWGIKGLIDGPETKYKATYAFSPRISTFK